MKRGLDKTNFSSYCSNDYTRGIILPTHQVKIICRFQFATAIQNLCSGEVKSKKRNQLCK